MCAGRGKPAEQMEEGGAAGPAADIIPRPRCAGMRSTGGGVGDSSPAPEAAGPCQHPLVGKSLTSPAAPGPLPSPPHHRPTRPPLLQRILAPNSQYYKFNDTEKALLIEKLKCPTWHADERGISGGECFGW